MIKVAIVIGCGRNKKILELITKFISTKSKDILLDCMYLFDDNLKICNGCCQCFVSGNCQIDKLDKMNEYKDKMMRADIILFFTTSYLGNISGLSKAFIERFSGWFQLFILLGKKGALLVVSDDYVSQFPILYLSNIFYQLGIDMIFTKSFSLTIFEEYCPKKLWKEIINKYEECNIPSENLNHIFVKCKEIILSMNSDNYKKKWWEQNKMFQYDSIYGLLNSKDNTIIDISIKSEDK